MMITSLLARLLSVAIGSGQDIVCWYEPPTGAQACFVETVATANTVGGVEFRHNSDGTMSVVVNIWEY